MIRLAALAGAASLLVVGGYLAYITAIAVRQGEGVFLPAGAVALLCLLGAYSLGRYGVQLQR